MGPDLFKVRVLVGGWGSADAKHEGVGGVEGTELLLLLARTDLPS